eukprot:gene16485-biopygen21798
MVLNKIPRASSRERWRSTRALEFHLYPLPYSVRRGVEVELVLGGEYGHPSCWRAGSQVVAPRGQSQRGGCCIFMQFLPRVLADKVANTGDIDTAVNSQESTGASVRGANSLQCRERRRAPPPAPESSPTQPASAEARGGAAESAAACAGGDASWAAGGEGRPRPWCIFAWPKRGHHQFRPGLAPRKLNLLVALACLLRGGPCSPPRVRGGSDQGSG